MSRTERFSARHGLGRTEDSRLIHDDAPEGLRVHLLTEATELGLGPHGLREVVCRVLGRFPDESNWTAYPNVWNEVRGLIEDAAWYRVYDIIEAVYARLAEEEDDLPPVTTPVAAEEFARRLNEYMYAEGIGWELADGEVRARASDVLSSSTDAALLALAGSGRSTAEAELREAIRDLARRPEPDITGTIQHAMAALECVARDVTGDPRATLGQILARHPGLVPAPLDVALEKAWGYASEMARHVREGRVPGRAEAELVLGVVAATVTYLSATAGSGP